MADPDGFSGGAAPAPLPTQETLANGDALLARARADLRDAWGPNARSGTYREARARVVAAKQALLDVLPGLDQRESLQYRAAELRASEDAVRVLHGPWTDRRFAPANLVAAAHALDDAWTQRLAAREDLGPEQTYAAVLAYRLGLVLAVDAISAQIRGRVLYPKSSGDPFFDHPFCPAVHGEVPTSGDVMGADVHHAAMAVALVRESDRSASSRHRGSTWAKLRFQLVHSDRACFYRLEDSIAFSTCPSIFVRHLVGPTLVVAVAPTQTIQDVLLDFSMNLISPSSEVRVQLRLSQNVRVHGGWATVAAALWPQVSAKINAAQAAEAAERGMCRTSKPLRVIFAGHSLGAAVATLLAMAAGTPTAPARLVTFGGPRVGDAAFQAVVLARTTHTRVVVDGDAVPRLPFGLTAATLHVHSSYAPVAAAEHWKFADSPASAERKVFPHRQDSAERFETPLLGGLLYGFLARHSFDVYKRYLVQHYDALVRQETGSGSG